jgi:hypothetical protein
MRCLVEAICSQAMLFTSISSAKINIHLQQTISDISFNVNGQYTGLQPVGELDCIGSEERIMSKEVSGRKYKRFRIRLIWAF